MPYFTFTRPTFGHWISTVYSVKIDEYDEVVNHCINKTLGDFGYPLVDEFLGE